MEKMLCQNQLCYTTGADTTVCTLDSNQYLPKLAHYFPFQQAVLHANCASPILGQYVTVQKYSYLAGPNNINEIAELDVEVYCGLFESIGGETSVCVIDEPDNVCERSSLIHGKSKFCHTTPCQSVPVNKKNRLSRSGFRSVTQSLINCKSKSSLDNSTILSCRYPGL